jgi:hypothetical protein
MPKRETNKLERNIQECETCKLCNIYRYLPRQVIPIKAPDRLKMK